MADKGFNGSTVSWGAVAITNKLLSLTVSQKHAKVKLPPESAGTPWVYVRGEPDLEISVEVAGGATLLANSGPADLTVTWNDGTTLGTYASANLFDVEVKGSRDNPISTTFKFAPAPASQTQGAADSSSGAY